MHDRSEHHPATAGAEPPAVGRPRGVAWRSLQAEGILWEGQVFLVGGDADLAARAIVTPRRLVFARGGEVALDVPRVWLRPAPFLRRNGAVVLNMSPPGLPYGDPPETLVVRMREGHPAAGHLVAMLAGSGARRIPSDLDALAAAIRPALPEQDSRQDGFEDRQPSRGRGVESEAARFAATEWAAPTAAPALAPTSTTGAIESIPAPIWPEEITDRAPSSAPLPSQLPTAGEPRVALVRQGSAPVASPRTRDWNLPFHQPLQPRSQRRHRWGWAFKLGGLVGLLTTAAALGAGRIPSPLDTLGAAPPTPTVGAALIAEVTATMAPLPVAPTAVPTGIGGPSGPVRSAPAVAPPLAIAEGSTESWAQPTAAPPAPAVIAPVVAGAPAEDAAEAPAAVPASAPQPAAQEGQSTGAPAAALAAQPDAQDQGAAEAPAPAAAARPDAQPAAQPAESPTPVSAESPSTVPDETPAPPPAQPAVSVAQAEPTSVPTATPAPEPTATPALTATAAAAAQPTDTAVGATPAFAVRLAAGGATLPTFGLPPSDGGNWIVVVADAINPGETPWDLAMDDFRLRYGPDGSETALDPGSDLVAAVANIQPAYAPGDVVTLAPGEAARLVLLFQIDPAAADLELLAGDESIDLAPALAAGSDLASLPADPVAP
jgi:hypothetical protein